MIFEKQQNKFLIVLVLNERTLLLPCFNPLSVRANFGHLWINQVLIHLKNFIKVRRSGQVLLDIGTLVKGYNSPFLLQL